ncbi:hypothetical protein [Micromonospora aurantiaca (nom. illeg.)]|uniref:hypothetical protein n=1 Tax=Micromonospora aurantiaca (nom. illeg.) TaxID=47850 RepID=UPI00340C568C
MNATAPWWAAPAFALAGVLLSQMWNLLAARARRRAERATRLDPEKIHYYREFVHACWRLLDLVVWPPSRTEPPAPTSPLTDDIHQLHMDITFSAPTRVTVTAEEVTTAAVALATTIDHIRDTMSRPTGGTLTSPTAEQYATARHHLTETLDIFIRAARRDIGITATHLPVTDRI